MGKCLILFLCLGIFLSCTQEQAADSSSISSVCKLDTTQYIEYNNLGYAEKYRQTQIVRLDDDLYLAGYNGNTNTLELLNLEQAAIDKALKFSATGPNRVNQLSSFYWHNIDSIFLLTPNDLLLTAFSGDVYQRWKINSGENSSIRGQTVTDNYLYNDPMNSAPIHYVANRPVLLAALKTQQFPPDHPSYFEPPILAALNIDSLSALALPIFYPDSYRQALYPANKPHFAYRNNSVYYLFPNSATVYRYQIRSSQLDSAALNSDFTEDEMAPFNGDLYDQSAVRAYLSSQPEFKNLIYDPFKDIFYRFHFGPYPYQIKGNEGKRGYTHLTVFTPDLEKLTEIQLPLTQQYYGATPTPRGLAIYTFNGSEDTNRLTFFNFGCSTAE